MKTCYKTLFSTPLLLLLLFLSGCKDDKAIEPDDATKDKTTKINVNKWLYDIMNDAYYWYKDMPKLNSLDTSIEPVDFFEKLVYKRETTDRFSMVTDDINALQKSFDGISKIFGIQYQVAYLDSTKKSVGLFLSMVVKGSPAEKAGLKRGDVIVKVNGNSLTSENYRTTLTNSETAEFKLAKFNSDNTFTETDTKYIVTKTEVTEDPIVFSTIISKPEYGKKIGYLVYNQFIPGVSSDENKYDNHLRSIFGEFKSQGVNELILDLRFNSGGYMSSGETLGSLIGKGADKTKVFYKEDWNDKYTKYWKSKNGENSLNTYFLTESNNIGSNLNRLIVLTTNASASCSELVINSLKPYMSVITIGEHTAGKNLFGSLIKDDSKKWNWGAYVMLGATANANNESSYGTINGIAPDYLLKDDIIPFKPFGDEQETLLQKALEVLGIPKPINARQASTTQINKISEIQYRDQLEVQNSVMISNHKLAPMP